MLREYIPGDIRIDGRNIPYSIVTAKDYLEAKKLLDGSNEAYEEWLEIDENFQIYTLLSQILGLKQSCYLMRRVSYSCGSLSDNLYYLKNRLIVELKEKYNFEFDDDFVEETIIKEEK